MALRKKKETILAAEPIKIDENSKNLILSVNEKIKQVCKKTFDNKLNINKEIVRVVKEYRSIITLKGSYEKIHMKYNIIPDVFEFEKDFSKYEDIVTILDSIKDKI